MSTTYSVFPLDQRLITEPTTTCRDVWNLDWWPAGQLSSVMDVAQTTRMLCQITVNHRRYHVKATTVTSKSNNAMELT